MGASWGAKEGGDLTGIGNDKKEKKKLRKMKENGATSPNWYGLK